jgi:hypothetical protein
MSEVTIKITGLSLCKPNFSTARGLEVLFIHPQASPEEKHALLVTIKTIPRADPTRSVIERIPVTGKTKFSILLENTFPISPEGLPNFSNIVNFDSYYGRALPLIKPHYLETNYLSIPHAQPFAENDHITYTIHKYNGTTSELVNERQTVGKKIGVKFRIKDATQSGKAGRLILRLEGSISTYDKELVFDAQSNYEIEFDNRDVENEPTDKNDYRLYYHLLDGRDSQGRKFTIIFQEEGHSSDQQSCNAGQGGGGCDFLSFFNNGNC